MACERAAHCQLATDAPVTLDNAAGPGGISRPVLELGTRALGNLDDMERPRWIPSLLRPCYSPRSWFLVYRRVRRNFGRQLVSERRLKFRVIVLALVGALILIGSLQHPLCSGPWRRCGSRYRAGDDRLHHTKFEASSEGPSIFRTLILVCWLRAVSGRLCYRLVVVYQQAQAATPEDKTAATLQRNHSRCSCLRC